MEYESHRYKALGAAEGEFNKHLLSGDYGKAADAADSLGMIRQPWKKEYEQISAGLRNLHIRSLASGKEAQIIEEVIAEHGKNFRKSLTDELEKQGAKMSEDVELSYPLIASLVEQGKIAKALHEIREPLHRELAGAVKAKNYKKAIKSINGLLKTHPVGSAEFANLTALLSAHKSAQKKARISSAKRFFMSIFSRKG